MKKQTIIIFSDNGRWSKDTNIDDAMYTLLDQTIRFKDLSIVKVKADPSEVTVNDAGGIARPGGDEPIRVSLEINNETLKALDQIDELEEKINDLKLEISASLTTDIAEELDKQQ